MERSQLKSIANNTGKNVNLHRYRKQRNLVVNLNWKEKRKFPNSLLIENDSKPFWEMCKLYLSKKGKKTSADMLSAKRVLF